MPLRSYVVHTSRGRVLELKARSRAGARTRAAAGLKRGEEISRVQASPVHREEGFCFAVMLTSGEIIREFAQTDLEARRRVEARGLSVRQVRRSLV